MNIKLQIDNLKKLHLPEGEYLVVSSGSLAIHNIREAKDIDVIVTQSLWSNLIRDNKVTVNEWGIERIIFDNDIEILNPSQSAFSTSKEISLKDIFDEADVFDGIKFMNLKHLKKIKTKLGRKIDLQDIKLIDEYFAKT